jgi:hypothetical protein
MSIPNFGIYTKYINLWMFLQKEAPLPGGEAIVALRWALIDRKEAKDAKSRGESTEQD